jgi:hypothetical protein
MNHDPLCPSTDATASQFCALCHCDLIAKVSEDVLAKALTAVQATITSAPTLGQKNAIAALQALQDTP